MKQSWHLIRKSMGTRIYHACMSIRICIENNQSGSGCVPDQQTATRYHKIGLVHSNDHKVCHSYHKTERNTNNMHDILFKFVLFWRKFINVGPPPKPVYFASYFKIINKKSNFQRKIELTIWVGNTWAEMRGPHSHFIIFFFIFFINIYIFL